MTFDETSLLLTTKTDVPLAKIEAFLRQRGYTLGYEPVSGRVTGGTTPRGPLGVSEASPPAGPARSPALLQCLAYRLPNRLALLYGEIDDICMAVQVERKNGRRLETKKVPRAAAGLDFKKIFIGSEGLYGRIVEATLRVIHRPQAGQTFQFRWKSATARQKFIRAFQASGLLAVVEPKGSLELRIRIEGEKEIVDAARETLLRLKK